VPENRIIIIGGGAAGFFAAAAYAEAGGAGEVAILERSAEFLTKVRISGGGRCNVTHACFEPRELVTRYPRGGPELRGPFQRFQPRDTVAWFQRHGVTLKPEADGRMFPVTDNSQTIVDCLRRVVTESRVALRANCAVESIRKLATGGFEVCTPAGGEFCERVLLATGGCRTPALAQLFVGLGHTLEPPVPSLFTFHLAEPWLCELAGVSVPVVEVSVPETGLKQSGPLLVTHEGVSGPAILRLSAWGARALHACDYRFPLLVNWLPQLSEAQLAAELDARRQSQPAKLLVNAPITPLPARLWERLVPAAGIAPDTRCAALSRAAQHKFIQHVRATPLAVVGKSLNKDEFVTCGGVRLAEVNFKTMESRICPGLYFAGEVLDLDGVTGGFNFQAAWTTGWIAGRAMAAAPH
jgi:hypothetical protein